jgi:lincosamide nucleotidyltransferase A/C/D/E
VSVAHPCPRAVRDPYTMMDGEDVVEVLDCLESADISAWLDGGWGVDALVARQTRPHTDLDLAIAREDLPRAELALAALGFGHDPAIEPGLPARFVCVDHRGRQVDFHPLVFDSAGNGWQQLSDTGRAWGCYEAEQLRATGSIRGRTVRCLSAELQLRFRRGYEWGDRDEHDVRLLTQEFDLPAPPPRRDQ